MRALDNKKETVAILRGSRKSIANIQSVIELFENQVNATPEHIAIRQDKRELSYNQFSSLVNKLSGYINQISGNENRIAILIENSIEMVAAVFAVLKSGMTYVPMDIEDSVYRNMEIVEDSNPNMILISKNVLSKMKSNPDWEAAWDVFSHQRRIITVEDALTYDCKNTKINERSNYISNLAYIIYTSGSTGKPKGVMVSHKNLINYLLWANDQYFITSEPLSFALFTSITFDLTITSLFLPLITGNAVIIYNSSNSGYTLKKIITENRVDIIKLTPTHLQFFESIDVSNSRLKTLIVGGEALKTSLAKRISDLFPSRVTIYNEYGPTEATVGCMIYKYNPIKDVKNDVPIGKPIYNTNIYILNRNSMPSTINETGEIYISGCSVASGYMNREDLTKISFLPDLYDDYQMMYKTNDLAFIQDDGTVMFIGRCDQQIKLHGYRIELGEIESHVSNIHGVNDSAVVLVNKDENNGYICAYIVCEDNCIIDTVREQLKSKLPSYMLPTMYLRLPMLPYTANGKVDRKKLMNMKLID